MKEQIETLVAIQRLEAESAEIQHQLNEASKRIEEITETLREKRQDVDNRAKIIAGWKASYQDFDLTLKSNQDLIHRSQERLKTVKTNREYQALLKEVEELKKQNARIEDEMLKLMSDIEGGEAKLAESHAEIQQLAASIEAETAAVEQSTASQRLRLQELEAEKSRFAVQTDPSLFKLFKRVRSIHNKGNAVVQVVDAVCNGCHMNIPFQLYNELQRCDSVKLCPNCQRIIYWQQQGE